MTINIKAYVLILISTLFSAVSIAQEKAGDKKEEDEFAKKKVETKLTEVVPTDSLPASELLKRAIAWVKAEHKDFKKSNSTTTGSKLECVASFPVKPKELNPQVDYTGKITMKVEIECKDSRYKYTVSEIKHISKSGNTSGGSVDNTVPECGSMTMHDIAWKKLKGEALSGAAKVVEDIKIGMTLIETEPNKDEW